MYQRYFGLNANPFSISPDTRFLFLSKNHREAIAHLVYALGEKGGFIQLTGEVGLGKTTVCRFILGHLPKSMDVALLLNPRVNELGLLRSICHELQLSLPPDVSPTDLMHAINLKLIQNHAQNRQTILIIDEAQNLPEGTLEMVRLLTNLETNQQKLLRVILIGQPELAETLKQHNMRQVAQRITGRFHLAPLTQAETVEYIQHRLKIAGCGRPLFSKGALKTIHKLTEGTPRLINALCDRALMGAYSLGLPQANKKIIKQAALEALPERASWRTRFQAQRQQHPQWAMAASLVLVGLLTWATVYFGLVDKTQRLLTTVFHSSNTVADYAPQLADSRPTKSTPSSAATRPRSSVRILQNENQDLDFRLGIPSIEPN